VTTETATSEGESITFVGWRTARINSRFQRIREHEACAWFDFRSEMENVVRASNECLRAVTAEAPDYRTF
jgi:hypothetical protein